MIWKIWERWVDIIQEVDNRSELLVIPNVLDMVLVGWIEVETNGWEPSSLTAWIDEADLLAVEVLRGASGYINWTNVQSIYRTSDLRQH